MKNKYIHIALSMFLISAQNVAATEFVDYEEVRRRGGFNSPNLDQVGRIIPAGAPLSEDEKSALILSNHLANVHSLDLSAQEINDDFINKLCKYSHLEKLINLDLSENPNITNNAIDYIFKSGILGRQRDVPQISGRYGVPASTIYIQARGTGVTSPIEPQRYFEKHRHGFTINYRNTATNPARDGVKFVEVVLD